MSKNCTLISLNLGWNSIRKDSAVAVANSLKSNHTLQSLNLAYNSFGDYPTQVRFPSSHTRESPFIVVIAVLDTYS